jgi:malonate transporter and related proteins
MQAIVGVTAPFFALVLLGWAVTRCRWLAVDAVPGLNGFVLFFALPAMLYRFSASTPIAQLVDAAVVAVHLGSAMLMVAVAVAVGRRQRRPWADGAFGALVATFPNSGFIGVPLLVALLGPRAAAPAIVALALDMVVTTSLCIALSQLGPGRDAAAGEAGAAAGREAGAGAAAGRAVRGMLRNPLPWAIALGTLSSAAGWQPPGPLMSAVEMLAAAASPVALFALGAMLARRQMAAPRPAAAAPPAIASRPGRGQGIAAIVALKLLLHPLLVFCVGRAAGAVGLPLDPFAAAVLVLVASLPSASNVPMLAERFGADGDRLARVVLWTTVAGSFSVSAAVLLLDAAALAPAAAR